MAGIIFAMFVHELAEWMFSLSMKMARFSAIFTCLPNDADPIYDSTDVLDL